MGYFFLTVVTVVLLVAFLTGWLVFSLDKKSTAGKISRVVYMVVLGGVLFLLLANL